MSIELFNDFEIEEEDEKVKLVKQLEWCTPEDYQAAIHDEGWFLEHKTDNIYEQRENDYNCAMYYYHNGDFELAIECLRVWQKNGDHKGAFRVQVFDSIIHAAVKSPSSPTEFLLSTLELYEKSVTNYGDQLQFWNAQKLVYSVLSAEYSSKFLRSVILLCSSISLPEHWLYFADKPNIQSIGPNFRLGYLTAALCLLEVQRKHSFGDGFVADKMRRDIQKLEESLHGYSQEQRDLSREMMSTHLLHNSQHSNSGPEEVTRPAHDCRSKIGILKTTEMCDDIVCEFRSKFSWMFEGM